MITRIQPVPELKQIFIEMLLNKTNKVTKVSDQSILNGIAYGNAKIAQKAMKDIGLVETHLFPEFAFGTHLDSVSDRLGISDRFTSSRSSTYVRVVGAIGTTYVAGVHQFSGAGKDFELLEDVTIGSAGFSYAKVRSIDYGSNANVDPLTITTVTPAPTGHIFCINEFRASGGRDNEGDDLFRRRIMEAGNLAARGTLAYLTQTFMKINNDVLKVYYQGTNSLNQTVLAVSTQNGVDLSTNELEALLEEAEEYLNLTDLSPIGGTPSVEIKNIEYQPIDISFRVELDPSATADEVRKDLQLEISRYFDYRFWKIGDRIEWDDLLEIVKSHPAVQYVPDTHFTPNSDILAEANKLPRVRGFLMMDTAGNIMVNLTGTLSPLYYPANPDFSFQATILASI